MELLSLHFKILGMRSLILGKSKGIVSFCKRIRERVQTKQTTSGIWATVAGDDQRIPRSCAYAYGYVYTI